MDYHNCELLNCTHCEYNIQDGYDRYCLLDEEERLAKEEMDEVLLQAEEMFSHDDLPFA